jgi:hypothetical protein
MAKVEKKAIAQVEKGGIAESGDDSSKSRVLVNAVTTVTATGLDGWARRGERRGR